MEALLCLSVFIVVSGIWAFFSNKKQARNRRGVVECTISTTTKDTKITQNNARV